MTYQPPELKADKGLKNGSCNRTACQKPHATYYNSGSYSYYCSECAKMLNRANNVELCIQDPEFTALERQEHLERCLSQASAIATPPRSRL